MILSQLTSEIENTRQKMYNSIKRNGINNKETIALSQELDLLINIYQKNTNQRKSVWDEAFCDNPHERFGRRRGQN